MKIIKKRYIMLFLIVLLSMSCVSAGIFDFFSNGEKDSNNDGTNITLVNNTTSGYMDHVMNSDEELYGYSVNGILKNLPEEKENFEIIGTYYDGDEIVGTEEVPLEIVSFGYDEDLVEPIVTLQKDKPITVDTVELVITNPDGKIVFNETVPFDMDNMENRLDKDSSDDDDTADSDSEGSGLTYVASVNSDKYHSPICDQAKKISDGNKITFSSKEEAESAGYEPCGKCRP